MKSNYLFEMLDFDNDKQLNSFKWSWNYNIIFNLDYYFKDIEKIFNQNLYLSNALC